MSSIYESVPPDFYDSSLHSLNPVTRYYHGSRYAKIRKFIGSRYKEGMRILDIGCGCSRWNEDKLPVVGLDQNREMLKYGIENGYLTRALECDLSKSELPVRNGEFDFVVISEVLEHLDKPEAILKEANRALTVGGVLIVTVPHDSGLSLWRMLFEANCILLGDILGNQLYRNRCGHVQHFSPDGMVELIEHSGFSVIEREISLMNIAIFAKKTRRERITNPKKGF
ncbi:MAG: class I SAM-dependent methyltransferase [Candidatus Micrarchaeota archaeon]